MNLPRRCNEFGIGRASGHYLYVHRDYVYRLGELTAGVAVAIARIPQSFPWCVAKINRDSSAVSFIESPDFNQADEPVVGRSIQVSPRGRVTPRPAPASETIVDKWLLVDDDYAGFDVEASKRRSQTRAT